MPHALFPSLLTVHLGLDDDASILDFDVDGVLRPLLAVGLALQRGPEFRKKMQNAQKALQEFDMQFDSFIG